MIFDRKSSRVRSNPIGTTAVLVVIVILFVPLITPLITRAQQVESPKRILLLYWNNREYAGNIVFEQDFRKGLQSAAPGTVEYYSEYLESNRFPGEKQSLLLRDYLRTKYADRKIDVIVAVTDHPLAFLLKYRHELFTHVPIVFVAVQSPTAAELAAGPGITGVAYGGTQSKTLDLALRLHPGTERVFIVSGTLEHDRRFEIPARRDLEGYENRVSITYLTDLPLGELIAKTSTLPERSIILYLWQQSQDDQANVLESPDVLSLIARSSRVPIYGLASPVLGSGIVGGILRGPDLMAIRAAEMALRIANGARAGDIPVETPQITPMFDWRQLQRWGISDEHLPPGSIVRFRELTAWERYKWQIIAALSVFLLEALLIAALIANSIRRRRAERSLSENRNRLSAILGTASEGILTINDRGIIESANAAAQNIFSYTADEMLGRNVSMVLPGVFSPAVNGVPDDGQTIPPDIHGAVREASGRRKDGSIFPIDLAVSEVVLADRRIFTGFVRDITERKQIEQMQRGFGKQLVQAQEAERARLARELHDDITQRLGLLAMNADRLDSKTELIEQRQAMRGIRDSLVGLSEDVHSLAYKLHPALLEHMGLSAALRAECERFSRQESIAVDVKLDELPTDIPHEAKLCLFRVAQEALRNVARHARAQAVQVSLHLMDGGLQLKVADNGAGFDPGDDPKQPSLGLASMRERVRLLEGKMHIESHRGLGTLILVWIPLRGNDLPDTVRKNGEPTVTNGLQVAAISGRGHA